MKSISKKYNIPSPFKDDEFELLQEGVYDDPQVKVYINKSRDFALLHPQPHVSYDHYLPRVKKLNLESYKKKRMIYQRRLEKISHVIKEGVFSLVEIGAGGGTFLEIVKRENPEIKVAAVETDQDTAFLRGKIVGSENYDNLEQICALGKKYDVICFFHILEHIIDLDSFFLQIHQLAHVESIIVAEVPSLTDPLVSLYSSKAYMKYYFQKQHPYIYSHASLERLMNYYKFKTQVIISYQRYGIENHLNWLVHEQPGGNEVFEKLFSETNQQYITELENSGKTDTVLWIGKC
jgi:2-polyprenyl-3-methyl-5-hydroxy-6-metoxy-1,4-benzoquinol methylase